DHRATSRALLRPEGDRRRPRAVRRLHLPGGRRPRVRGRDAPRHRPAAHLARHHAGTQRVAGHGRQGDGRRRHRQRRGGGRERGGAGGPARRRGGGGRARAGGAAAREGGAHSRLVSAPRRILVVTSGALFVRGGHLVIAEETSAALRRAGYASEVLVTPQNRFGRQMSAYLSTWLTDVGETADGQPVD